MAVRVIVLPVHTAQRGDMEVGIRWALTCESCESVPRCIGAVRRHCERLPPKPARDEKQLVKVRLASVRDRMIYGQRRIRGKGQPIPFPIEDVVLHNEITGRPKPNRVGKTATIVPVYSRC